MFNGKICLKDLNQGSFSVLSSRCIEVLLAEQSTVQAIEQNWVEITNIQFYHMESITFFTLVRMKHFTEIAKADFHF